MNQGSRALIVAVSIGLMCAPSAAAFAQDTTSRPDTVRLRFEWRAGTSARIESASFQERRAETADTVAGSTQYRMNVNGHADGLLISYDRFVFPPQADTTEAAKTGSLAEQAAAIVPKFIVDAAGAFVRIDDVESVRAQFDSLMTRMLAPEDAAATREMLAEMLTEEALMGLAAHEWNALVGMWADAELEVGETYQYEEQAELPMIPGAIVRMISEFSVERRIACTEGGAVQDCVEIRLVSRPDPAELKAILAQFTGRLLATPGLGGIEFESLDMDNEMVLITEPLTLKPHSVSISKSVTGVVAADGQRSEVSQVEVRTFRYTYIH